ncbi:hypothetical protein BJF78_21820 [Pseudonocardia sp. CNS-139]|nr:hypothetical protein BJF78_21820 [Pseudonocardia sp. CNS-139]
MPLAIELAAARVRVLAPAELLTRLSGGLALLTSGARDAPARQRTLRATLDWSHDLLDPAAATTFRRLAVFAGGWNLEWAERVCGDGDTGSLDVLDAVTALTEANLLHRLADQGGRARFRMHEIVRQYAVERLRAAGEEEAARRAHAACVVGFVERAAGHLTGPEQVRWHDRLDAEQGDVHVALEQAVRSGDAPTGLRIAVALWRYWEVRGRLAEGRRWLGRVLALPGGEPVVRAHALKAAGSLARLQSDAAAARAHYGEALALFTAAGDAAGVASTRTNLGNVALDAGDAHTAIGLYEESLAAFRDLRDEPQVALLLNNLALALRSAGRHAEALPLLAESLELFRARDDLREAGGCWRARPACSTGWAGTRTPRRCTGRPCTCAGTSATAGGSSYRSRAWRVRSRRWAAARTRPGCSGTRTGCGSGSASRARPTRRWRSARPRPTRWTGSARSGSRTSTGAGPSRRWTCCSDTSDRLGGASAAQPAIRPGSGHDDQVEPRGLQGAQRRLQLLGAHPPVRARPEPGHGVAVRLGAVGRGVHGVERVPHRHRAERQPRVHARLPGPGPERRHDQRVRRRRRGQREREVAHVVVPAEGQGRAAQHQGGRGDHAERDRVGVAPAAGSAVQSTVTVAGAATAGCASPVPSASRPASSTATVRARRPPVRVLVMPTSLRAGRAPAHEEAPTEAPTVRGEVTVCRRRQFTERSNRSILRSNG